jgi:hypothetical protein
MWERGLVFSLARSRWSLEPAEKILFGLIR